MKHLSFVFLYAQKKGNRSLSWIFVSFFKLTKTSLARPPLGRSDYRPASRALGSIPSGHYKNILSKCYTFCSIIFVRPEGIEPPTPWFEAKYSIH